MQLQLQYLEAPSPPLAHKMALRRSDIGRDSGETRRRLINSTFHLNCLQACSSPTYGPSYPVGTLAYVNATSAMVASGFPFGSKIAMLY